jgi:uncharacterized protein YdeI (YjbR/CyaY-like superfamily)
VAIENEPRLLFPDAAAWERWLGENHGTERGLWLQIAKKGTGIASVTYDEALDIALCYGWIDGQRRSLDAEHFVQRFTPRRRGSAWSKRNVGKVAELIAGERMRPPGLAEVEAAKNDGRWEAAYDSPKDMEVPADFQQALDGNEGARAHFAALTKSSRYAILLNLQLAKTPATRARRIGAAVAMLEKG